MEYLPNGNLLSSVGALSRQAGAPIWKLAPQILPPSDPPQDWMLRFLQDCRQLARVRPVDDLFRLDRINLKNYLEYQSTNLGLEGPRLQVADLERALESNNSATMTEHPLTLLVAALCDHVGIAGVVERLGGFVVVMRVFAWLVQLNKESYDALGDLAPRTCQLTTPHPIWVNMVAPPPLREALFERRDLFASPDFFAAWANGMRLINWPYRPVDALRVNEESGDMWLTEAFIAHALRGDNWQPTEAFATRWPGLRRLTKPVEGGP